MIDAATIAKGHQLFLRIHRGPNKGQRTPCYAKGQTDARAGTKECFYVFNPPQHQTPEYKEGYRAGLH